MNRNIKAPQDRMFMAGFTKACCVLTGDDYYRLEQFYDPQSNKKIQLFAMLMLLPMLVWAIAIYSVATGVFETPWWVALISSVFASLIVLIIERSIVMSDATRGANMVRILLALTLAAVGAFLVDEIIFAKDIDVYIAQQTNEKAKVEEGKVQEQYQAEKMSVAQQVEVARQEWIKRNNEVNAEAGGLANGLRGAGSATRAKRETAALAKKDYEAMQANLDQFESIARLQRLQEDKNKVSAKVQANANSGGLMIRIGALFDLIRSNIIMLTFWLLLTFLFFLIEILPVTLKNNQKLTLYEYHIAEHTKARFS
jgi:hypothetical protein